MRIKEINELLTKAFQQECCLEDNLKSFYTLRFPSIASIIESEEVKNNCERFLSQYDIKTGTGTVLYSTEASKAFLLQINKLSLDKFLENLTVLIKDVQLHEAVNKGDIELVKRFLDDGGNIHSRNIFGETLENVAAKMGHAVINEILLNHSAGNSRSNPVKGLLYSSDQVVQKDETFVKRIGHKPVNQVVVNGATKETEAAQRSQKMRNLTDFFSPGTSIQSTINTDTDADESQIAKQSAAVHLPK